MSRQLERSLLLYSPDLLSAPAQTNWPGRVQKVGSGTNYYKILLLVQPLASRGSSRNLVIQVRKFRDMRMHHAVPEVRLTIQNDDSFIFDWLNYG